VLSLLVLLVVVYELPEQCCCLQCVVWASALTQCEAAADGQPVTRPDPLSQVAHKAAAVDGLQVLPQVTGCKVAALLLLLLLLLREPVCRRSGGCARCRWGLLYQPAATAAVVRMWVWLLTLWRGLCCGHMLYSC